MNINLTLLGEMITFAVLVVVTMKYIWPPIVKAMADRQKKIADGLEAAERGEKSLELAQQKISKQIKAAKQEAATIIDNANQRVTAIIDEAKVKADHEGKRLLTMAKADIAKEMEAARDQLQTQIADLVIALSEKVVQKNLDVEQNRALIEKFIKEI